ncbi:MAG: PilZ domain-containing protein [Thermodesulfobacteriaceae bacterium]|jgi:hypothetical protein
MIDDRKFKRINIEILANLAPKVYFPGNPSPYQVLNISFAGLFIKGQTNYKRGEILDIELEIPAIGRIPMSVEVVWIDSSERKGIGVEIHEIPEVYKKIWACFVKACHCLLEAKEGYQKIQAKSE